MSPRWHEASTLRKPLVAVVWLLRGETIGASLAILDGRVYTADPETPWAEALACEGDRILMIGTTREIERHVTSKTRVVRADRRLVLPGFIDAHVHLIWGYELGPWVDLTGRPTFEEIRRRVAAYAEAHPDDALIIGHGFDYSALRSGGLPGREDLDAIVSDRPVLLTAWDGHTGWGNSRFTERALAVIQAAGKEVGEPVRDPNTHEPTGVFHRAFDLTPLLPEFQSRRSLEGLRETVRMASRLGITTAFDVQVNREDLHAYKELRRADGLVVRIRAAIYHPEETTPASYDAFDAARRDGPDDWLRVEAVKLYIDGVQETGTAALLEPYAHDSSSIGTTVYPTERFHEIVGELDRRGFQICTHACGDRGVRIALDAYEEAVRRNGHKGLRHRIEHCENLDTDDIPRFAQLGVIPCMMPRHASTDLTTRWREVIGPGRTRTAFPWRGLLDAGAALAFSSDWPVAEMDPLVGIHEAVSRRMVDGTPSSQRVSVREAIDGYTIRAAFACHAEASRGSLAVGKYADLVLLSENLFELPPDEIPKVRVVRTIVGGRTVFSSSPSRPDSRGRRRGKGRAAHAP